MDEADYQPPVDPSAPNQRDALRKGLGRAVLWARQRKLNPDVLLEACLTDWRLDQQLDHARGSWLWECIDALGCADRFRPAIWSALQALNDEHSADQLCQLAEGYAARGDRAFLNRLYEIFQRQPFPDRPWLAEEEILSSGDEAAFLFVIAQRGRWLASRDWEWDDRAVYESAVKSLGEERTTGLLTESYDPEVARYREAWLAEQARVPPPRSDRKEELRAITPAEVIEYVEGRAGQRHISLRGWGTCATEPAIEVVLEQLFQATGATIIARYLQVISARAMPKFDARILRLREHADSNVRRRTVAAIEPNTHPIVRALALESLIQGRTDELGYFTRNYQPGDEALIAEHLRIPADDNDCHDALRDVSDLLQENAAADVQPLGAMVYSTTPCAQCRFFVASLLRERNAVPDWLREEARLDAEADTRGLFPS